MGACHRISSSASCRVMAAPGSGRLGRLGLQALVLVQERLHFQHHLSGAIMGQAGQYNLPRCLARKEFVAASVAEAAFIEAACSAIFLLHKRYKPFYKWAHHGLALLPAPAGEVATALNALVQAQGGFEQGGELKVALIERICTLVTAELHRQRLSNATDTFMLPQAESVQAGITDPALRALHLMLG